MPIKNHIEWPYVALVVAIVLMIVAAAHLLSAWVALRDRRGFVDWFCDMAQDAPMISGGLSWPWQ